MTGAFCSDNSVFQDQNIWLPVTPNLIETKEDAFFYNPETGKKKILSEGWIPVGWSPIVGASRWLPVHYKSEYNFNYVNIDSGKLLRSLENSSIPLIHFNIWFHNGFAPLLTDKGSGLLTQSGEFILTEKPVVWASGPKVDSEGFLTARFKEEPYEAVFVDTTGKIHSPKIDASFKVFELGSFENGLAPIEVGKSNTPEERILGYVDTTYGYVDTNMNIQIAPQYQFARSFIDGAAWVMKDDLWGQILENETWKIEPQFKSEPKQKAGSPYFIVQEYKSIPKVYSIDGNYLFDLPIPTHGKKLIGQFSQTPNDGSNLISALKNPSVVQYNHQKGGLSDISFIDEHLVHFSWNRMFYTFDLLSKKFVDELSGNFWIKQSFFKSYSPIAVMINNTEIASGFIKRDGKITFLTPLSGEKSVIWPKD